jgi:hypothetical protein
MPSLHTLIGRIIDPGTAPRASVRSPAAPRPVEPLEVLIGRIVHPTWATRAAREITAPLPQADGDDGTPLLEVPAPM